MEIFIDEATQTGNAVCAAVFRILTEDKLHTYNQRMISSPYRIFDSVQRCKIISVHLSIVLLCFVFKPPTTGWKCCNLSSDIWLFHKDGKSQIKVEETKNRWAWWIYLNGGSSLPTVHTGDRLHSERSHSHGEGRPGQYLQSGCPADSQTHSWNQQRDNNSTHFLHWKPTERHAHKLLQLDFCVRSFNTSGHLSFSWDNVWMKNGLLLVEA